MLRSAITIALSALALSWAGPHKNAPLKEQMVPVRMADGSSLLVSPIEVTQADWAKCLADHGCSHTPKSFSPERPMPVISVNWFDVQEYLAWANARNGGGLRLPTKEEWRWLNRTLEKPKPAPLFTDPRLAWAATYGQEDTPGGPLLPSGSKAATPDGIFDLSDNVWEWTATCAMEGYDGKDAANCPAHVVEGAHEAVISVFERNPAAGGCATGTPPTYLGLRLVADIR